MARGVRRLVQLFFDHAAGVVGVRVEGKASESLSLFLTEAAPVRGRIAVQWIDNGADAASAPAKSVAPGIRCDCSLAVDAVPPRGPYIRDNAYVPTDFDARVPASTAGVNGLVQIPRSDGRALSIAGAGAWAEATRSPERRGTPPCRDSSMRRSIVRRAGWTRR